MDDSNKSTDPGCSKKVSPIYKTPKTDFVENSNKTKSMGDKKLF